MGFFDDIVRAITDLVSSIITAVGGLVTGIFGNNPLFAAVVIFAIAWFSCGTAFTALWEFMAGAESFTALDMASALLAEFPFLTGSMISVFNTAVGTIWPEYNRTIGFVSGLLCFMSLSYKGYLWYTGEGFSISAFSSAMTRVVGAWYPAVATSLTMSTLYNSQDPEFMASFEEGFAAIPSAAADALDVVVSGVGSSFLLYAGLAALAYFAFQGSKSTERVSVQMEAQPT